MKRALGIIALATAALGAKAQTLNIVAGGVTYAVPAAQAGYITYQDGSSLTVLGKTIAISDISRMYVDNSDVTDNSVSVSYNGQEASVTVAGNIARYVSPAISGAHVSVAQSEEAGDDTSGEITFSLSGNSDDGSFTLDGSYKATVELLGLQLSNPSGAALALNDGKRIALSVKKDTENSLADGAEGSQKGCIASKGHLEMKGKGKLSVTGNAAHAIYSKEYVEMKNCTVSILAAAKDGINAGQYFLLESGELSINGVGDDAVQVSFKDDADREAEDTGAITIKGGLLSASVTATASKGLKAEGPIAIEDGTVSITTSGGGKWDSTAQKTKAAACISSDTDVSISGGTLTLSSTGSGGKGISCDGMLSISGGTIGVTTTGGMYAYVNGTEYTNYTGNADRLQSDQKSSPKGMKADGNVDISGGDITVSATGNGAEGIESKAELTVSGGTVNVSSYDDCINSSSHMYIKGGDITVVSSGNDGLDSNGNLYIMDGTIRTFGATSPECGIDANDEEGYSVIFTGGTLLAVGGSNSVPSSAESTQPYVSASMSVSAGSKVSVRSGDEVLATFSVPDNYTAGSGSKNPWGGSNAPGGWGSGGGSVLVTCAGLTSGNSYTVASGDSTTTATATLRGSGSSGRPW